MRKKISMFVLFLTMAISLSACGGPSKESLLKNAITADPNFMQDIVDGAKANEARRCLKIGNVPNGEGFFRQTKPI